MDIKEIKNKVMESGKFTGGLTALVKTTEECVASNGKPYLKCVLQDKTGEISMNKWDFKKEDAEILRAGTVVQLTGVAFSMYNNDVSAATSANTAYSEIVADPADFKLTITPGFDDLKSRFNKHYTSIKNPELRIVLSKVVKPRLDKFKDWPAAESMHHNERHGLMYHTIGIMDLVDAICSCPNYQNEDVDVQLIKVAAMVHDIAKINEYVVDDEFNGRLGRYALKGHIVMASEMIHDLYRDGLISEELELNLCHLILSHHGKKEWGSPVVPSTLNAYILHMADNMDAKTYSYKFNFLSMDEGEYGSKGVFELEKARLYRSTWHSSKDSKTEE